MNEISQSPHPTPYSGFLPIFKIKLYHILNGEASLELILIIIIFSAISTRPEMLEVRRWLVNYINPNVCLVLKLLDMKGWEANWIPEKFELQTWRHAKCCQSPLLVWYATTITTTIIIIGTILCESRVKDFFGFKQQSFLSSVQRLDTKFDFLLLSTKTLSLCFFF